MRAQQAHPADAATRPEDRSNFESWIRPDSFPDLHGGAADGQAVGRPHQHDGHSQF